MQGGEKKPEFYGALTQNEKDIYKTNAREKAGIIQDTNDNLFDFIKEATDQFNESYNNAVDNIRDQFAKLKERIPDIGNELNRLSNDIDSKTQELSQISKDYVNEFNAIMKDQISINNTGQVSDITSLPNMFTEAQTELNKMKEDRDTKIKELSEKSFAEAQKSTAELIIIKQELERTRIERKVAEEQQTKLFEFLKYLAPASPLTA